MPQPRLGFGYANMVRLKDASFTYIKNGFDTNRSVFCHCLSVMEEYLEFHKAANYKIDETLEGDVKRLLNNRTFTRCYQIEFTRKEFLEKKDSAFESFALSRYTVRNYCDKEVSDEVFMDCALLAQKSPSACNRQPNHLYIIRNKDKKEQILSLQNGNRGFGHLADALVVFTGDLSSFRYADERNEVYFNSGLFSMTFIYALHHKGIGSCALNWSVNSKIDAKIRRIVGIPDNETVTMVLSCGYLPEVFKVAASPRRDVGEIITFL